MRPVKFGGSLRLVRGSAAGGDGAERGSDPACFSRCVNPPVEQPAEPRRMVPAAPEPTEAARQGPAVESPEMRARLRRGPWVADPMTWSG